MFLKIIVQLYKARSLWGHREQEEQHEQFLGVVPLKQGHVSSGWLVGGPPAAPSIGLYGVSDG